MKTFEIIATAGKARAGILITRHGKVETPAFMPVATKASVKYLLPHELEEAGTQALIANAFVLSLRPGLDVIKKHKGLHEFMQWNKTIFTDSGGFQMLEPSFFIKKNDDGIEFRNPFDGAKLFATPELIAEIQQTIHSDVAMVLDDVVPHNATRKQAEEAVNHTTTWAQRFLNAHTDREQLVFGITQGGMFKDLREQSAKEINALDIDGVAIGGLCVGEDHKTMHEMLKASLSQVDARKPRYLMGVGSPVDLLEAIEAGVDIFDSAMPTRNARHNELFSSNGKITIDKKQFCNDEQPADKDCSCIVCKNYTRAYLHHLARCGEETGQRLNSHHNIWFIQNLMVEARESIKQKTFAKFKKEFVKNYNK